MFLIYSRVILNFCNSFIVEKRSDYGKEREGEKYGTVLKVFKERDRASNCYDEICRRKTRPSLLIFTMIGNDGVSNDLQPVSLERTRSPEVFHLVFRLLSKHRCFRCDISINLVKRF